IRTPLAVTSRIVESAVVQAGDVWMHEPGKDSALVQQPLNDRLTAVADQLEGHALLELPVGALGEVYDAHPTASQAADDAVRANPSTRLGLAAHVAHERRDDLAGQIFERPGGGIRLQQRCQLPAQLGITGARPIQESIQMLLLHAGCGMEELLEALPSLWVHLAVGIRFQWASRRGFTCPHRHQSEGSASRLSSRFSHARAIRQSRFTVAFERCIVSAVSSTVSPPKKR